MRNYSMEWLANRAIILNAVPRPFAGKYPTRLAWRILTGDGVTHTYQGRPSLVARQRLLSLLRTQTVRKLGVVEYDRSGPLMKTSYMTAFKGGLRYLGRGETLLWADVADTNRVKVYYSQLGTHTGWSLMPWVTVPVAGKFLVYKNPARPLDTATIQVYMKALGVKL